MTAYPPDDSHTQFSVKRCCEKSLEGSYECDNCDHKNVRYWCVFHRVIATVKDGNIPDRFDRY